MAAPKGNKNGVGHGRPPNQGFSEKEVIALGEELIEWINDPKINADDKIVHLSQWYSYIKNIRPKEWDALQKRDCFLPYYEKAMRWMGNKLLTNKAVPPAYGSRFIGIYFRDVHGHEKEIKDEDVESKKQLIDYEVKLKATSDLQANEEQRSNHKELIATIKDSQSERKIEESKIKAAAKS